MVESPDRAKVWSELLGSKAAAAIVVARNSLRVFIDVPFSSQLSSRRSARRDETEHYDELTGCRVPVREPAEQLMYTVCGEGQSHGWPQKKKADVHCLSFDNSLA
jgi:hypothetical protein